MGVTTRERGDLVWVWYKYYNAHSLAVPVGGRIGNQLAPRGGWSSRQAVGQAPDQMFGIVTKEDFPYEDAFTEVTGALQNKDLIKDGAANFLKFSGGAFMGHAEY